MCPDRPCSAMKRALGPMKVLRRCPGCAFSTAAPNASTIAATLTSRKAKLIPDTLSPTNSHLLNITLADLIPSLPAQPSPHTTLQPLPQGHHLVYFPIQTPPSELAPDGADLDHWPGPPFHRRMWAAGEVKFREGWAERMVLDGRRVRCVERIEEVNVKGEGQRQKVFVDVWRRYGLAEDVDGEDWPIEERRTLVFMPNAEASEAHSSKPSSPKMIKYPHQPTASYSLTPSSLHLFNFSALTYNAHAIHLDPRYAQSVDGHRNLLVHGPLTLALMLRVVSSHIPQGSAVKSIVYRNHAPLYVDEEMRVCVRKLAAEGRWDVWVENAQGGLSVKGTVVVVDDRGLGSS
ncbi:hypothetical protein NLU13_6045 [Sarocladium strictum]|uniref:Uncharacterized protein n=1 Tax=Sarocladium strictum TaxID=5046 RepID=A0AA39L6R3_SARSR|nr:hypothetical protein NLU13_6045 [Sarocladium strictum]